jgi:redox-sensitive bicupin YhaK (pirin superfamily)
MLDTTKPALTVRKAEDRGHVRFDWLDTKHTFSFGEYFDPNHMGFHGLRVINDDRVAAGAGFPPHPHRDMEIVTYVLDGALAHKDSMGNGSVIRPGDVQCMSAGTGVRHSEYNASDSEPVHLLQIWILPAQQGTKPGYEEKQFAAEEKRGRLRLVAAPDGRDGAVTIHADAAIYAALLDQGETVRHSQAAGRSAWLHVARGAVTVNGRELKEGDGVAAEGAGDLEVVGGSADAELLLFDLAA